MEDRMTELVIVKTEPSWFEEEEKDITYPSDSSDLSIAVKQEVDTNGIEDLPQEHEGIAREKLDFCIKKEPEFSTNEEISQDEGLECIPKKRLDFSTKREAPQVPVKKPSLKRKAQEVTRKLKNTLPSKWKWKLDNIALKTLERSELHADSVIAAICKICDARFATVEDIERHVLVHNLKSPFRCFTCKNYLTTPKELRRHVAKCGRTSETYQCDICKKMFRCRTSLIRHLRTHEAKKPLKCYICEGRFEKYEDYQYHLKLHEIRDKLFLCETCGERFSFRTDFVEHLTNTHPEDKEYPCRECTRTFSQEFLLSQHIKVHTGQIPYTCLECDKTFCGTKLLSFHVKTHIGDKLHKCLQCGLVFRERSTLIQHLTLHTQRKRLPCSLCPRTFLEESTLQQHFKVHNDQCPFYCAECNDTFCNPNQLSLHLKAHQQEIYKCKECGKNFILQYYLNSHKKIHNRERTKCLQQDEKTGLLSETAQVSLPPTHPWSSSGKGTKNSDLKSVL